MLARKISASSGTSATRNGRSARVGCARAIIAPAPRTYPMSPRGSAIGAPAVQAGERARSARRAPHLPLRERVSECAARSSRHLPLGLAVLGVFEDDAHLGKLIADAIGLGKILGFASGVAG